MDVREKLHLDRVTLAFALSIGYWVGVLVAFVLYFSILFCYRRRRKAAQPIPV